MDSAALPYPRITPWVGRLLAAMAGVALLRATIFVSPAVEEWLRFDPALGLTRPWTVVTYAFVHGGVLHLLFNGLALFLFGPSVERRLGGPGFLLYFLYCVVGAAAFALVVQRITPVPPFVGASGGIVGVLLAYAWLHPDQELIAFPIPVPIKARTMVILLACYDMAGMLFLRDLINTGTAHEAHLGGLLFGWIFIRMGGMGRKVASEVLPPRPRVHHHASVAAGESDRLATRPTDRRPPALDPAQAELDRVLDKISATGMNSLTATERKFLDEVAKKKKEH
ncbi:MAG TPA: rhomboid family intramembrane serine protease [Gemmatimonadales bacterium]